MKQESGVIDKASAFDNATNGVIHVREESYEYHFCTKKHTLKHVSVREFLYLKVFILFLQLWC